MQRRVDALASRFDLLVVGGGVHGACIARLASRSGLKVALVEQSDFCGATSRNSAKLLHGGLRYIQHLDVARIRDSMRAQRAWFHFAPHLVRPLRFVVPAYGHGSRGPAAFAAGAAAFHAVVPDRNRGLRAASRLPISGLIGHGRLRATFPVLDRPDVTGGMFWFDGQMLDASRLVIECLHEAADSGAVVANHVRCVQLCKAERSISGAVVRDELSGKEFEIEARVTINAAGPWSSVLPWNLQGPEPRAGQWTVNMNLVTRSLHEHAVGFASVRAPDSRLGKARRLLFASPWHGCSIVGTTHEIYAEHPDALMLSPQVVDDFVTEIDAAAPEFALRPSDVCSVHLGLTPAEDAHRSRTRRSLLIDHEKSDGIRGLLSIVGIKFTTAPVVAEQAVQTVLRLLGMPQRRARFDVCGSAVPTTVFPALPVQDELSWATRIYGKRAATCLGALPVGSRAGISEEVFQRRVIFGMQQEMAVRLGDALFRATDWAERGLLTERQLTWCADTMATALRWTSEQKEAELARTRALLSGRQVVLARPGAQ